MSHNLRKKSSHVLPANNSMCICKQMYVCVQYNTMKGKREKLILRMRKDWMEAVDTG